MTEDIGKQCCCDLEVHPDHLRTESLLLDAGNRYMVVPHACHLLFAEATIFSGAETDPMYVKLFTSDDPDTESDDETLWAFTLPAPNGSNAYTPNQVAGLPAMKGLFAYIECDDTTAKVMVNVVAVQREHYVHAFPDTTEHLNNAWKCRRSDDFMENYDQGENNGWDNDGSSGSSGSEIGSEPIDF